jgi:hypothetical protein
MDEQHDGLTEVMARLAAGDGGALVALLDGWRPQLASAVRSVAASRHVRLDADAVDELIVDVVVAIADVAAGWSPEGGAAPWVWARHQVARAVDRHLGQFAVPLDPLERQDERAEVPIVPAAPGDDDVDVVVARLAQRHQQVALLDEAVRVVATERDRRLFWETALQRAMGDPSPACTVGAALGVAPTVVRQQHRRVRLRIQHLAATDPRFEPVGCLAVVA